MLDIRVRFQKPLALSTLRELGTAVKDSYPRSQARVAFQSSVSLQDPKKLSEVTTAAPKEDGYLYTSSDGKQVFQARLDGFTFNRIYPYDRWATFVGEAKRLWGIYRAATGEGAITHIALRYINVIEVPIPCKIEDYILTSPVIAPDLPQDVQNFFMRLVLPFPAIKAEGILISTMEPPRGGKLPLVFDTDVFKGFDSPVTEDTVWAHFEDLRKLKNLIFEKSTSPKAKELFQ